MQEAFGLSRALRLPELDAWLDAREEVGEDLVAILSHIQQDMHLRADSWTEEEWKLSFIGPVISLVDYNTETMSFFSGRQLEVEVSGYLLTGVPDGMIASGTLAPKAPYFCLHEFKKEEGDQSDPRGQLLAAMVASQAINQEDISIYGAYVLGRFWFFCVLSEDQYAFSDAFSATKNELFDIVGILMALKTKLAKFVGNP